MIRTRSSAEIDNDTMHQWHVAECCAAFFNCAHYDEMTRQWKNGRKGKEWEWEWLAWPNWMCLWRLACTVSVSRWLAPTTLCGTVKLDALSLRSPSRLWRPSRGWGWMLLAIYSQKSLLPLITSSVVTGDSVKHQNGGTSGHHFAATPLSASSACFL